MRLRVRVGDPVDESIRDQLDRGAQRSLARRTALRYLSIRPRSVHEVRMRLQKAGVVPEIEDEVIEWLKNLGYLDDSRFAADWIRYRSTTKKLGSKRLKYELQQKGICKSVARDALSTLTREEEFSLALESAMRRRGALERLDPPVAKRRLIAYLQRRGFEFETILRVVSQVFP